MTLSAGGWYIGDRVEVDDPALAQLRAIFEKHQGEQPPPNNVGIVDKISDDGQTLYIIFDDSGQCAPYPAKDCTRVE